MGEGVILDKFDRVSGDSQFLNDSLASFEFMEAQKCAWLTPEKNLMLAILEDAAQCLQKYCRAGGAKDRKLFSETKEWMDSTNGDYLFSFVNICETLNLDADYIRRGIDSWIAQAQKAV